MERQAERLYRRHCHTGGLIPANLGAAPAELAAECRREAADDIDLIRQSVEAELGEVDELLKASAAVAWVDRQRADQAEQALAEAEEALRSTQQEYAEFRERMLEPLKDEGRSIESLSWDDLLGVAARNLSEALRAETRREKAELALAEFRERVEGEIKYLGTQQFLAEQESLRLGAEGNNLGEHEAKGLAVNAKAAARRLQELLDTALQPTGEQESECFSCGEGVKQVCPKSKRPCGHHCNCSWTNDRCHWCGKEFGEQEGCGGSGEIVKYEDEDTRWAGKCPGCSDSSCPNRELTGEPCKQCGQIPEVIGRDSHHGTDLVRCGCTGQPTGEEKKPYVVGAALGVLFEAKGDARRGRWSERLPWFEKGVEHFAEPGESLEDCARRLRLVLEPIREGGSDERS